MTCTYIRHLDISYSARTDHSCQDDVIIFSAYCTAFVGKCGFVEASSSQILQEPLSFEIGNVTFVPLIFLHSAQSWKNLNLKVDLPYEIHPLDIISHHKIVYELVI